MPYTRYFYPGTENPSLASVVFVDQGPGVGTYHFPIPSPQKQRPVAGFVYWPDGRPAEKVGILLEDVRWPWQTNVILATTDSKGHFEISAFDETAYRVHAGRWLASPMNRFPPSQCLSAPGPISANRSN